MRSLRRMGVRGVAVRLVALCLLVWPVGLSGCRGGGRFVQLSGQTMGTTLVIKFAQTTPPLDNDWVLGQVDDLLKDINSKMSTYDRESELSRFNAFRETTPFSVSTDTLQVFSIARQVSDLSGGAFDITVGPLVNIYGFGPDPSRHHLPSDAEIAALREWVGYDLVEIDPKGGTLRKQRPEVYCDLSAVAKGYGVDVVAQWLEGQGVSDYMVEIGGEVRTRGRNPEGRWWRIGVEKPDADSRVVHRVILLQDMSVATSGDYRNFLVVDGQRISHTIDPRAGRPISHHLASATVLRPTCAEADALATALSALGPEEGFALAEREGIAALLIVRQRDGAFEEIATSAFRDYEERF